MRGRCRVAPCSYDVSQLPDAKQILSMLALKNKSASEEAVDSALDYLVKAKQWALTQLIHTRGLTPLARKIIQNRIDGTYRTALR